MLIREIFFVSLAAIRANLLRSFLTTLGIIIGVGAVITMVALGEGAQRRVEDQIQRMGTDVLTIRPERARNRGVAQGDSRLYITDAEALREELGAELTVAPQNSRRMQISLLRWNTSEDVFGTWPELAEVYNLEVEYGRFFNQAEVQGRRTRRSGAGFACRGRHHLQPRDRPGAVGGKFAEPAIDRQHHQGDDGHGVPRRLTRPVPRGGH